MRFGNWPPRVFAANWKFGMRFASCTTAVSIVAERMRATSTFGFCARNAGGAKHREKCGGIRTVLGQLAPWAADTFRRVCKREKSFAVCAKHKHAVNKLLLPGLRRRRPSEWIRGSWPPMAKRARIGTKNTPIAPADADWLIIVIEIHVISEVTAPILPLLWQ
jgi:hypothetical protein